MRLLRPFFFLAALAATSTASSQLAQLTFFKNRPVCTGKTVFVYNGASQNLTVPAGCTTITVKAWGGGGGGGASAPYNWYNWGGSFTSAPGGGGGFAQATLTVTPGAVLTVIVGGGGEGGHIDSGPATTGAGGGGGYFGGGGTSGFGGGGGGGSGYATGMSQTLTAGSGTTPAQTGDADYAAPAGTGGSGEVTNANTTGISGQPGRVVVIFGS